MPSIPFKPILVSLRHHRMTALLLLLQVALTCAVVINAIFMISSRIERISTPTGLPEQELSFISVKGLRQDATGIAQRNTDLAALRSIPGVRAVAAVSNALPLTGGANDSGGCASQQTLDQAIGARSIENHAGCVVSTSYDGSSELVQALGAKIISGRVFNDSDMGGAGPSNVIVSQALAQRLWPGQSAVGKRLYGGTSSRTVVGVMADILRPRLRSAAEDHLVLLSPMNYTSISTQYLLRSAPQDRQRILHEAAIALAKVGPQRLIPKDRQLTFTQVRQRYFQRDTTMIGLLVASSLALLFVTALGIGGLANFWVAQRTRQIGIRRAVGATRGDILRHFQAENFLIVGAGVVLGMILAFGLNQLLMRQYELDRLPLIYLPLGALLLWALGQLAVLGPARRAAQVPPAIATRAS